MTSAVLAVRARGLDGRLADDRALDAIERAPDRAALAERLAEAGVVQPFGAALPDAIDLATRARTASDLAVLARWSPGSIGALDPITLDEDRRTLAAIVRGIAAGAPAAARAAAAIPTARLSAARIAALADAPTLAALATQLERFAHPLAPSLAAARARTRDPIDVLAIELALARRFAELASRATRDRALRAHVAQILDAENALAARMLAARGADLDPAPMFLTGGARLDRAAFVAAATASEPIARAQLAAAFAGTPLAAAFDGPAPTASGEEAALAWHLATQARLRRVEPLGLAAVLHHVLRRRAETMRLRRAVWRVALSDPGGAP